MSRVFANGSGEQRSVPGRVIPKTLKMVLDAALLNTQHYKVFTKEKELRPPIHVGVEAIEKGTFGSPSITVTNFYLIIPDIDIMVRVFANGPRDLGSIPGRVIPKTQKWYLMLPCLTLSILR